MTSEKAATSVVFSGNLGVGKTTLIRALARVWGCGVVEEPVDANPFLEDFYSDLRRYSFHLQVFLLGYRASAQIDAAMRGGLTLFDRSVYEDGYVFSPALKEMGYLAHREFQAYQTLFGLVVPRLPAPRLIVYLEATPQVLLARIRRRGLRLDQALTIDYLESIAAKYREWLQGVGYCEILHVDASDDGFAVDTGSVLSIARDIRGHLGSIVEL